MGLHASRLDQPADQVIVDAILGRSWMTSKETPHDLAGRVTEGSDVANRPQSVGIFGTDTSHSNASLWLLEVQYQVSLGSAPP